MSRHWFDGGNPLPLPKPGALDERIQARVGAARLVARNGGTADDLRVVLSALDLWPSGDHPTADTNARATPTGRSASINGR